MRLGSGLRCVLGQAFLILRSPTDQEDILTASVACPESFARPSCGAPLILMREPGAGDRDTCN
jgi:hypothetical protein